MRSDSPSNSTGTPRLTVRVCNNSMTFVLPHANEAIGMTYEPYVLRRGISLSANLREAFQSSAMLQGQHKRGRLVIDSNVMLTPIELYEQDYAEEIYGYTFVKQPSDELHHHVLPDLNCVATFPVNKDLKLVLTDNFENLRIVPLMASVWSHLHDRSFTGRRRKLYAYFNEGVLHVCCFSKNRFKFCNRFGVNNSRDAVYYLLYTWKTIGYDGLADELHLLGNIPDKEWTLTALKQYMPHCYVINPTADFNRSPLTKIEGVVYDVLTLFLKRR